MRLPHAPLHLTVSSPKQPKDQPRPRDGGINHGKSKQYLTTHSVDNAHITDIFSIASTPRAVLSVSGSSTIHIHDTTDPAFPLKQSISDAHKLGCHHICTSRNGRVAASAGFGGEVKIWNLTQETGEWSSGGEIQESSNKPGEVWALALSDDGTYLATTTYDGRVNVWNLSGESKAKVQEYETGSPGSGSFGLSVDLSRDGKFTASGHQNGSVYIFNNETGRILFSLSGLAKPVRSVAFSPGNTRLAAAGDSGIIALYDMKHGEHVANLTGHTSWITSVDWSDSGEFLLSGSMDGKVKVWSIERSACVATHSETDKALWTAKWLPKTGKSEMFCTAGANRSLSSTSSNRGRTVPIKGQSTISFANRITKNVVNDTKKAIISPPVAKIESPGKSNVTEKPIEDVLAVEPELEAEVEEEPEIEVPEKSEVELKAEKITKKQIEAYWKGIEAKRIAPRVHQKDLSTDEKVLRYFDVSSQYGPCIGIARRKRWDRAERLGLNPPVEVLAVLVGESRDGGDVMTAQLDVILNQTAES
ncbi:unnamed protein product [Clonostachys solani]|uniref:EML-like second beta-propeller domain-containing protein n=1 Tax=Clonostachys solani TaxID=160281 RepID=A0A9N9W2H2_9HYPO|nr:unnamed protein product [Clonostachys solani]